MYLQFQFNNVYLAGRVQNDESIMWYPSHVTTEFFQNPLFEPVFEPIFSSEAARLRALDLCGEDENCVLDYATTENSEIAFATKAVNSDTKLLTDVLGNLYIFITPLNSFEVLCMLFFSN